MAPTGKTPETGTGLCGELATSSLQSSGVQERCPVRVLKETDGTPKSRSTRTAVVNMGSPTGRESYGDGVPAVVGGVTSAQSGDR
jgi:hypothetical protein